MARLLTAERDKREIVFVHGDTHGGHELGLMSPDTILLKKDGHTITPYTPPMTPANEELWEIYTWGAGECEKLAGRSPVVAEHGGDPTQGIVHVDGVPYIDIIDQSAIAQANFAPILRMKTLRAIRMTMGTDVHEDGVTKLLYYFFEEYPRIDAKIVGHGLMKVGGVGIDFAHHGPGGGLREWLSGNLMRYYTKSVKNTEQNMQVMPPDVLIRHHYHTRIDETVTWWDIDERHQMRGIICPSLELLTAYARKATQSQPYVVNGTCAIEIVEGKVRDIHWWSRTRDMRERETL